MSGCRGSPGCLRPDLSGNGRADAHRFALELLHEAFRLKADSRLAAGITHSAYILQTGNRDVHHTEMELRLKQVEAGSAQVVRSLPEWKSVPVEKYKLNL